jgi:hypothetical protein
VGRAVLQQHYTPVNGLNSLVMQSCLLCGPQQCNGMQCRSSTSTCTLDSYVGCNCSDGPSAVLGFASAICLRVAGMLAG